MITHHEVAVSMSKNHLNTINKITTYEINLMKDSKIKNDIFNDEMTNTKMDISFRYTQGDL
jgi:hypothetical protein